MKELVTEGKLLYIHYYDHIHRINDKTPAGDMCLHVVLFVYGK